MTESLEVRWFLEAAPFPPSVFFDRKHLSEPSVDWYASPCGEQFSVKLRDDRLETKIRIASLGSQKFPHAAGNVEHWAKWSTAFRGPSMTEAELESAGWVAVEKLRYIRIFAVDDSSVREVDSHPKANTQFEWTAVTASDRMWCSIAFDAFGDGSLRALKTNLTRLIAFLFKRRLRSSVLTLSDSFGYPRLLQTRVPSSEEQDRVVNDMSDSSAATECRGKLR